MADLIVELYGEVVGTLDDAGPVDFDFHPSREGIRKFGLGSTVLSVAVPLDVRPNPLHRMRRRNFFDELLPEGDYRAQLAALANVRERDTIGLLRAFGRDVAGAAMIYDPSADNEPAKPRLELLTDERVGVLLDDASRQFEPLGNDPERGRSSLGGVQHKILLARQGESWCRPLGGAPSTHILKVSPDDRPTQVYDEQYGHEAAVRLGLATHSATVERIEDRPVLVVERYDRDPSRPGLRIHQEDFNQALGLHATEKYESLGNVVNLARVAQVVAQCGAPDLQRLARLVTLAVAIGNLDLHAKNISLLHPWDGSRARTQLAPAYDVVPLAHHAAFSHLAMLVGGVEAHADVTAAALEAEFAGWGVRDAQGLVRGALADVSTFVAEVSPQPGAHPRLRDAIRAFVSRLQAGQPAGTAP